MAVRSLSLPLMDHDLWWHLACGRDMVLGHFMLRTETFSHTLLGAPWINFEWLSQIVLYLIYSMAGLKGLWIAKFLLCMAVLSIVVVILRRSKVSGPALWLLTTVLFMALKPRLYDRVELASLLLFPVVVALLASVRSNPWVELKKIPWMIGAVMVVWVNLHGGYLYAMIAMGAFCIGARWSNEPAEIVAVFDRSLVLAFVAMLVNPYGPSAINVFVEHWMQIMNGPAVIQEWITPRVREAPFFWILFVAASVGLIAGFLKLPKQIRFWALTVLLFAVWGTRSSRNIAYASIAIVLFLAELIRTWPNTTPNPKQNLYRMGAWIVSLTLLTGIAVNEFKKSRNSDVVQESRFPFAAIRFLQHNNLNGTLYNTYHFGGAIEWAMGHATPVFMDGRYLFYPLLLEHAQLDNALLVSPNSDGWRRFLDRYHVDMAITEYGPLAMIDSRGQAPFSLSSANLMFPRNEWALVYWDDTALVFLKRVPRFEVAIRQFEYSAVWPYNLAQMEILLNSGKLDRERVKADLSRNGLEVPRSYMRQEIENILAKKLSYVE